MVMIFLSFSYYLAFMWGALCTEIGKAMWRAFRPRFVGPKGTAEPLWCAEIRIWLCIVWLTRFDCRYTASGCILTSFALNHFIIPFIILRFDYGMWVWSRVHFMAHGGALLLWAVAIAFKQHKSVPKTQKTT